MPTSLIGTLLDLLGDVPDLIDDNPVEQEAESSEHSASDAEGSVIGSRKRKKSKANWLNQYCLYTQRFLMRHGTSIVK